jgi:hypothetical protein
LIRHLHPIKVRHKKTIEYPYIFIVYIKNTACEYHIFIVYVNNTACENYEPESIVNHTTYT